MNGDEAHANSVAAKKLPIMSWPTRDTPKVFFLEWPEKETQRPCDGMEGESKDRPNRNSTDLAEPTQMRKGRGVIVKEEGSVKKNAPAATAARKACSGGAEDEEIIRLLKDSGWNVSQNVRKTGRAQWYFRSPDGCLLGSLATAMVKWKQLAEGGGKDSCGTEENSNSGRGPKRGRPPKARLPARRGAGNASKRREREAAAAADQIGAERGHPDSITPPSDYDKLGSISEWKASSAVKYYAFGGKDFVLSKSGNGGGHSALKGKGADRERTPAAGNLLKRRKVKTSLSTAEQQPCIRNQGAIQNAGPPATATDPSGGSAWAVSEQSTVVEVVHKSTTRREVIKPTDLAQEADEDKGLCQALHPNSSYPLEGMDHQDVCRRMLKNSGWEMGESVHKNGKVQKYYRSPSGCLLGSLLTAIDKWTQVKGECSIGDHQTLSEPFMRGRRPQVTSLERRLIPYGTPNALPAGRGLEAGERPYNESRVRDRDISSVSPEPNAQGKALERGANPDDELKRRNTDSWFGSAEHQHQQRSCHLPTSRDGTSGGAYFGMESAERVKKGQDVNGEMTSGAATRVAPLSSNFPAGSVFDPPLRLGQLGPCWEQIQSEYSTLHQMTPATGRSTEGRFQEPLHPSPALSVGDKLGNVECSGSATKRTPTEEGMGKGPSRRGLHDERVSDLPDVRDEDECRRVLVAAGWKVSESVRKSGKSQWYYRSPNGCLLGSLLTAMIKWRQMEEDDTDGGGLPARPPRNAAKLRPSRQGSKKSSEEENVKVALDSHDRAEKSSGRKIVNASWSPRSDDDGSPAAAEDESVRPRPRLWSSERPASRVDSTNRAVAAGGKGLSPGAMSSAKRKAMEAYQLVVTELLGLNANELNRRHADLLGSQSGFEGYAPGCVPFQEDRGSFGIVRSPVQKFARRETTLLHHGASAARGLQSFAPSSETSLLPAASSMRVLQGFDHTRGIGFQRNTPKVGVMQNFLPLRENEYNCAWDHPEPTAEDKRGDSIDRNREFDEGRRILRDAGWNVSQSLRKNGKVQWYYRSPNGCLLGSLSTALNKWRKVTEEQRDVDVGNSAANIQSTLSGPAVGQTESCEHTVQPEPSPGGRLGEVDVNIVKLDLSEQSLASNCKVDSQATSESTQSACRLQIESIDQPTENAAREVSSKKPSPAHDTPTTDENQMSEISVHMSRQVPGPTVADFDSTVQTSTKNAFLFDSSQSSLEKTETDRTAVGIAFSENKDNAWPNLSTYERVDEDQNGQLGNPPSCPGSRAMPIDV